MEIDKLKVFLGPKGSSILPIVHVELWYPSLKTLKGIKSSSKWILFLTQNKDSISIKNRIKDGGELLGELELALVEDLNLGKDGVLIQSTQNNTGMKPPW